MARKKSVGPVADASISVESPASNPENSRRTPKVASRRVVRRIDGKVLLIALIVIAVLAGGLYSLHAYMVDRNAGRLLDQATRKEEKGEFGEAAADVSRYLRLRPNDVDALERLAGLLRKSANSRQGWSEILSSLEHVLRLEPNRHEARRTAISTAMKLRRFSDAESHLNLLAKNDPELRQDPRVMLDAARTAIGLGNAPKNTQLAVERYLALILQQPDNVSAYAELAALVVTRPAGLPLRDVLFERAVEWKDSTLDAWGQSPLREIFPAGRGDRNAKEVATKLVDEMVRRGQPTGQAFLARASYRSQQGDLVGASADLNRALEVGGADESEIFGVAAAVELAQARQATSARNTAAATNHRQAARGFVERGLKTQNPDPKLHLLLAEISLEQNAGKDREELLTMAETHLRDGLEQVELSRKALQPGDFEKEQTLVETEVQLRWSLSDFMIDRLAFVQSDKSQLTQGVEDAQRELESLRESGCRPELVSLLKARLLLAQDSQDAPEKWQDAISALERARVALVAFPELRKRADLLLGDTYRIVNNPDRRIETFRRALAEDPLWEVGGIQLAKALAAAGRTQEAIEQYSRVASVPEAALEAARLTLVREWQKPEAQRDFASVDQFLTSAENSESFEPAVALVRAQRTMASGNVSGASQMLTDSTEQFPDEITLWQAAIALETQRSDVEVVEKIAKAEDLIRKAEGRFDDRVELRLSKIEVARLRGPESLRAELKRQIETAPELTNDRQVELFENLVRYAAAIKEPQTVHDLWKNILALRPNSIPAWLALANLAIESGDEDELKLAVERVQKIEGSDGPNGKYLNAAWQLRQIATNESLLKDRDQLTKQIAGPRKELQDAADQRPYWAAVPRMLGMLETMAQKKDDAFAAYQRAFQLGDRSLQTIRGLVDYHNSKGSYDTADAIIRQVDRETPGGISGDLARMAAQVAFDHKRIDAAIDWTKRVSSGDSEVQESLAHAHLLFLKYQSLPKEEQSGNKGKELLDEARTLYRQVVDKAPEKPETWFAFIVHFMRIGDKETAVAAIDEASQKLPAEPASARLASLAQYYEVVQMPAEAAKHYRLAVEADPANPTLRRVAADFFFRSGQLADANVHLEYLLDPKNNADEFAVTWARRSRAITTAAAGRYDDVRRALGMLRSQTHDPEDAAKDLRAQLMVLGGRNTLQDRIDRIEILEQLQSRGELNENEKLQLASLYTQTDMWPKARDLYRELLISASAKSVVLSEFLAGSFKHEPAIEPLAEELRPRLGELRALEPNTIRTTITAARFEQHFGDAQAASKLLTEHAESMSSESSDEGATVTAAERVEIRMAADAAEELRLFEAADSLFAEVAEHAERPEDALVLATYYGRRGRYAEGLDVVEKYAEKALPDATAVTAVNVISSGPVPKTQIARAEKLVTSAQAAEPQSHRVTTSLAGLRSIQSNFKEAETLYRRVLADQPENVAVLNNLAWLLALTGSNPDEASRLVDEAIRVSGPIAALLDTRGTVEMSRKRVDKAISDLQAAYADNPTPYIAYHIALAYDQSGNKEAAREHLRTALRDGLTVQSLHPAELETYRSLLERLGMTGAAT